jgi:alanyl-tRNA synthetase
MKAPEARKTFIDFFGARGHTPVPSSPVIPHGDPTILFTNAGMNQFKDVFAGREKRSYVRAVTSQKCIRAGGKHNDLDNVGRTARHLTFFEMLGNFSFGDYFKEEAIHWAWELLTGPYGLDPDRLFATVYEEDAEAREIWRKKIGLPARRIVGCGKKDNFWSMGDVGPCGPCSEILFDRGEAHRCGPQCGIGKCDCDRYFEVWNLVFMQFDQAPDGTVSKLPRPSIDTGMGLERLCMVIDKANSVYETDLLAALTDAVVRLSGRPYDPGPAGVPHRVIADHLRSLCFALADGAYPANEGRGYVVRRILRRAARYGRKLGLTKPFLSTLVPTLSGLMGDAYPELRERHDRIVELVLAEEERFGQTLDLGLARFEEIKKECAARGSERIEGKDLFSLHDTYGFPPDLVERMAEEENMTVDMAGYEALMEEQKARSRSQAAFDDAVALGLDLSSAPPTAFRGYETTRLTTEIVAVNSLSEGRASVVLAETPFYAEAGGQVGDRGVLEGEGVRLVVDDTQRRGEHTLHLGLVEGSSKKLAPGATVIATVAADAREKTRRNHTATHLLHAALRALLGAHVEQRGSLVAPDRLRFDFTHFSPVSREELRAVERHVNEAIVANVPLAIELVALEEARARGAMALFGEKYGETVRMVSVPGVSSELCGGTHVARTGDIGMFKIVAEGSVAAGIRRIEAVTGPDALHRWYEVEDIAGRCAEALKTSPASLLRRIQALQEENRQLRQKKAAGPESATEQGSQTIGPLTAAWRVVPVPDMQELRGLWDRLRDKLANTVLILFGKDERQVNLLVCLSPDLRERPGLHCGDLARAAGNAMAAGGGGRPEMGQAGGKQPEKLGDALAALLAELRRQAGVDP